MKLLELFSEDNGHLSNIRLNATALVFAGIFIMLYAATHTGIDANTIAGSTMLITVGIGGKLVQKSTENGKNGIPVSGEIKT